MPKNPETQLTTITYRTVPVPGTNETCIEMSPQTLQFCKRDNHLNIFLHASNQNTRPVELFFDDAQAALLFSEHPNSPLTLAKGDTKLFKIKKNIPGPGLKSRPDFGPPTGANFAEFGRIFSFTFERCDDADGNDIHIEC